MGTNSRSLKSRLANFLVKSRIGPRLVLIGDWNSLFPPEFNSENDSSNFQADLNFSNLGLWSDCFESCNWINVDDGRGNLIDAFGPSGDRASRLSARQIAVTQWAKEINDSATSGQKPSQLQNQKRLIVVCQLSESAESGRPPQIQIGIHSDLGTAEATLDFLPMWNGKPSWELVGQAVCQLVEMITKGQRTVWSHFDPSCRLTFNVAIAKPEWNQVLNGVQSSTLIGDAPSDQSTTLFDPHTTSENASNRQFILPGSFAPLHSGHNAMASFVEQTFGGRVDFELSVVNVDKPPLDFLDIEKRAGQDFSRNLDDTIQTPARWLWLTRAPTFDRKSKLFPNTTFLVGADTITRIGDAKFYSNSRSIMLESFNFIAQQRCRFMVFGRVNQSDKFMTLADMNLPKPLLDLCDEIAESEFRIDVSSTQLRNTLT